VLKALPVPVDRAGCPCRLPVPAHLTLDAANGLFMALLPGLLGFARNGTRYCLPHVSMGTADVAAAVTTRTR
jgi:hypothetical protein